MNMKRAWLVVPAVLALSLGACSASNSDTGSEGSESSDAGQSGVVASSGVVLVNGSEPQNPLIPANTNETGGGHIVDSMFAGLVYYDETGTMHNDVAESIETDDSQTFTIKIKPGQKFSDGSAVTASSFVDAWKLAAKDKMLNINFFEPIEGADDEGAGDLTGLNVVDDTTFTVKLKQPESDFPLRLGYSAFYPLPEATLNNLEEGGEHPITNGPYMPAGDNAWTHNEKFEMVPNPDYDGPRKAQNGGVTFVFYANDDAAYNDLLAGNLDVLDRIPDSAIATFQDELGERAVNQGAAVSQAFTIPERLEHFSGEEGQLRREAISYAIDRPEITEKIFGGTRSPAKDFTSPAVEGYAEGIEGSEVLNFDAAKAKELWEKADAISPWSGKFEIGYNADGPHQGWVDAVANQLKNNLGIDAVGRPYPDFKSIRDEITNRTITSAFRSGWQADYPSAFNFLSPLYGTGAGSNDGDYSSEEFDSLLNEAAGATSQEEANDLLDKAQTVLFKDLPAIPLWNQNGFGGFSENVDNVAFDWKSMPVYYQVTKN